MRLWRLWGCLVTGLLLAGCSGEQEASVPNESVNPEAIPAVSPQNSRDGEIEAWLLDRYAEFADGLMYRSARIDLNGNGSDERLVYAGGPMLCGSGGCNLHILQSTPEGFVEVTRTTVTQLPLGLLDTSTNGWRDIWVTTYGGGLPKQSVRLSFDGSGYPPNPTVAPAEVIEVPGQIVIEDEALMPVVAD